MRSRFEPELLVLGPDGVEVTREGRLIAATADALDDHRERPAVPRGRSVRVGAVDGLAVVDDRVTGPQADRHLAGLVLGAVVGDPLREPENVGPGVRPDSPPV